MKFPTLDSHRKRLLLGGVLVLGVAGGALAVAHPLMVNTDPASLPRFDGTVAQYSLSPRGDVDGLILADGTEVHFPPHLGSAVQAAVRPGDAVTVHGRKSGPVVLAGSVTGVTSGTTVVDKGPPARGPAGAPVADGPVAGGPVAGGPVAGAPVAGAAAPAPVGRVAGGPAAAGPGAGGPGRPRDMRPTTPMEANGTVKMALHGPRGEVNGALLGDGTVVRLPPDQASTLVAMLQPGQALMVQGDGVQTDAGRMIAARQIGPSADKLTTVKVPPPPPAPPAPPAR